MFTFEHPIDAMEHYLFYSEHSGVDCTLWRRRSPKVRCLRFAYVFRSKPKENVYVKEPMALRVLVVDDNQDFADSLAAWMRLHGHTVLVAYDAASGLRAATDLMPQIIFHDIAMPDMDGIEAARRLRSDARFQSTTLVAVTAYAESTVLEATKAAGYNRYMRKPVAFDVMLDVLNEVASGTAQ